MQPLKLLTLRAAAAALVLLSDVHGSPGNESRPSASPSGLRFARIFTDHLVLQRDKRVPVWGWARPGQQITVRFRDQEIEVAAASDGKWLAWLNPMPASRVSERLTATCEDTTTSVSDVLVGEVWIAAGQSNMERIFTIDIKDFHNPKLSPSVRETYREQMEAAPRADHPQMRVFKPMFFASYEPMTDYDPYWFRGLEWEVVTPQSVLRTSTLPYFFGKELLERLEVPIGLIELSVSGSCGAAWTRRESLDEWNPLAYEQNMKRSFEQFSQELGIRDRDEFLDLERQWRDRMRAAVDRGENKDLPIREWPGNRNRMITHNQACSLFNSLVHPTAPYAVRGVIWHQGEGGPYENYDGLITRIARDWQLLHRDPSLVFLMGTLAAGVPADAPVASPGYGDRPIRPVIEGQVLANATLPRGACLNFTDLGNGEVHWGAKGIAGRRFAAAARALCYGESDLPWQSPLLQSVRIEENQVRLTFAYAYEGLAFRDPTAANRLFSLAGRDRRFQWAKARIENSNEVVVRSDQVPEPEIVVYQFATPLYHGLINSAGLPAFPFRTADVKQRIGS